MAEKKYECKIGNKRFRNIPPAGCHNRYPSWKNCVDAADGLPCHNLKEVPELVICPKENVLCRKRCPHSEPHKPTSRCFGICKREMVKCVSYRPEEPKKPVLSFAESTFLLSCYQEELKKIIEGIELIKHGLKIRQQQKE